MYSNFKQNIGQQLNPEKGLFFFYSQDLTNNYKNYVSSNKPKEKSPRSCQRGLCLRNTPRRHPR